MTKNLVVIKGIEKDVGMKRIVQDMSFSIKKGEIVVIIGPNGSGKTTTLEMILGIQKPTKGEIAYWTEDFQTAVGVQLQSTPFFPGLTAKENLQLFACFYKKKLPEGEIDSLLKTCSLHEAGNTDVAKLSGGQLKRLSIATALVHHPTLVFLDEPTAALDPLSRKEIHQTILDLKYQGKTVVLTSHDMDEAAKLSDRILFFHSGSLIAEGSKEELFIQYHIQDLEELYMSLTKGASI